MKICIPLVSSDIDEVCEKIKLSAKKADIIEIWLGEFFSTPEISEDFEEKTQKILEQIFTAKKEAGDVPLLINVKDKKEKGGFSGSDEQKIFLLQESVQLGAEYIDIDFEFNPELLSELKQIIDTENSGKNNPEISGKTQLILSAHFFEGTPTFPALKNRVQRMQNSGADIVKIATMPKKNRDLITILRFAENMKKSNQKFIAMSMAQMGKISRVLIPLLGGEMMFAPLTKEEASAPGQICRDELLELEKVFSWK
ncbi:TPA: type I 3-dehydroquinate dehydratase [Candidatus Peregrinibacteria bacterium]|nr:type I 3-dehydroquinate dehydratase [Candidatus Peregrinibacteria bacterium]